MCYAVGSSALLNTSSSRHRGVADRRRSIVRIVGTILALKIQPWSGSICIHCGRADRGNDLDRLSSRYRRYVLAPNQAIFIDRRYRAYVYSWHVGLSMQLHLILGRTGIGKTARSVALAKQAGAPVIVLDRVQVYRELTIGSGRPLPEELDGTTRIYLTDRRVAEGELLAAEAYALLLRQIETLGSRHSLLILEGGSVSLCTTLFENGLLEHGTSVVQYLPVHDESAYRQRLFARIRDMLHAHDGRMSILDELAGVWGEPQQRSFVQTIGGYSAIVNWCSQRGISPLDLPAYGHDPGVRADLAAAMLLSYLEYSYRQRDVFHHLIQRYARRPHIAYDAG
jgi:adenylate dimethylallyltransferase